MSSPQDVDRVLAELEQINSKRLIDQLRPLFPTIDAQIRAGVSRKDIVEALQANGLDITLKYLDKSIYRWRRKRKLSTADHQGVQPRSSPQRGAVGTQIPLIPEMDTREELAVPSAPLVPTVTNRGDVARLRRTQTTDLNYLAQLGKKTSSRRNT